MTWTSTILGEVLRLQRGHDLTDSHRQDGDIPVISSSGITGRHNEAKAKAPGVVTGRYGTIGRVFYVDEDYWPLNTALYVTDFKGNHPRFVAYLLQFVLQNYQSDKAAVPGVNRNVLHTIKLRCPDATIQLRIADILSAYDDLIENNHRRMALLENAARQLYSEWFVRLRFPGHEHTHIINGVPKGWEPKTLGDLCHEMRDTVNPKSCEADTPYIGLEHMPRRSISLTEWGSVDQVTSSKHRFWDGEILFGKIRPYFHKVGLAFIDGVASSDAIIIRPNEPTLRGFILLTVSSDTFVATTAQTMREGSKMPRADWKQMQAYPTPLPPAGLLVTFENTLRPMIEQLRTLTFASKKLRAARDLLLPRLMSGEIAV